ncbi:MAG: Tat pathway signal protein [Saprospiraceae bacterium]|nr:Tat pathway signal protein [Saprospiraceae bacterium]
MNFGIAWRLCLPAFFLLLSCQSGSNLSEPAYNRNELKHRTFNFFWELAHPENYQIPDRYPTLTFSSIAATGFGLSAYLAGIENGYISRQEGAGRVLATLEYLWNLPQGEAQSGVSGYKGFYYHFLNLDDATRYKQVELSSIDTGLLMAGVLSVMSYFDEENVTEKKIKSLADSLYQRVDWAWMLNDKNRLSMGWHPEKGFIESDWKGYNEAMILLIMAMGSPTHPIPASCWQTWCSTYDIDSFYGEYFVQFDPLFGHQYSHIWIDFRGIRDSLMQSMESDYFENSKKATLSNRAYCIDNPGKYAGYSENVWGLTACDGPANLTKDINGITRHFFEYRARGASAVQIVDDGTIAPTAAGGSFAFTPELSENALKHMWERYNKDLVGKYGFKDAFNLTFTNDKYPAGWFDVDYLGIDQGPILLQIQNHETELLWKIMKKNPYIIAGLKKAGFKGGWLDKLKS